jgi:hypothetical protein
MMGPSGRQAAFTVAAASPPWAPTPGISSGRVGQLAHPGQLGREGGAHQAQAAVTVPAAGGQLGHLLEQAVAVGQVSNCRSLPPGLEVRHSRIRPLPSYFR